MENVERCIMALVWRDVYWMDGSCDIHGTERNEVNSMDREQINKIYSDYLNDCESEHDMEQIFTLAYKAIRSAEPKTGHWIDADGDNAICGCCNRLNHLYGTYCKHCGARMIELQEGSE